MVKFMYVKDMQTLHKVCEILSKEKEIGIDLECENNLHHYGVYITLIQISTTARNYIIDTLAISNLKPLVDILENQSVLKVFHDVSFDLRVLFDQYKCRPKNIFDTQLAALFLGKTNVGLGSLLEKYFGVKKVRKYQRYDWTRRPISYKMLEYAVGDSAYLLKLKNIFCKELKERATWVQQECVHVENLGLTLKRQQFFEVTGARSLEPKQLALFHRFFALREQIARKVDKPVFMIIRNKLLLELAVNPKRDWKNLKGVHRQVRKDAPRFIAAVRSTTKAENYPQKEKKRLSVEQSQKRKDVEEARNIVAEKLKIERYLIMSKEQILHVIVTKKFDSLRQWQRELMESKIKGILDD